MIPYVLALRWIQMLQLLKTSNKCFQNVTHKIIQECGTFEITFRNKLYCSAAQSEDAEKMKLIGSYFLNYALSPGRQLVS